MKKAILIYALSRSPWIGGIYYKKNIVNMLLKNEKITNKYRIVILVNAKFSDVFESLGTQAIIIKCSDRAGMLQAIWLGLVCSLRYRIRYVFPVKPYKFFKLLPIIPVSWIADFQHCYYPDFFDKSEIRQRDADFQKMAMADNPLVLSSRSALEDLKKFFSKTRKNVYVVHFSSCIDAELEELSKIDESVILQKLGLDKWGYIAVCNQFWQHKNHIVVLQAIRYWSEVHPNVKIKVVFTGELSDRRNPQYVEEIKELLRQPAIRNRIQMLGFLDRMTQICVMKYAQFVIQPSLFEGWGTVVEDAKMLGKKVLLSDIPVHHEQMEDGIFFDPTDPKSLISVMWDLMENGGNFVPHIDDKTEEYALALNDIFV